MALLVLIDRDATHSDPVKSARGCYKRGDIVAVHEDSAHDGDLVKNPVVAPWYLIRVTGVSAARLRQAIEPEIDATDPEYRRILRRRAWRIEPADLPLAARRALQRDRYLAVTLTQARTYVRNKTTAEALP